MKLNVLFGLFALTSISQAQVFVRTEEVNGIKVQVYSATVIVDLPTQSREDLDKAYTERTLAYRAIKTQATELANTRVVSDTKQTIDETKTKIKKKNRKVKEQESITQEKFSEVIQVTSSADVEIKPISEATIGKILKTDIEIRVSPIASLAGANSFNPDTLGDNELFDTLKISNDQKYLITLKKGIIFDENDALVLIGDKSGVAKSSSRYGMEFQDHFYIRRFNSSDVLSFSKGSFVSSMKIDEDWSVGEEGRSGNGAHAVFFEFRRGGENFRIKTISFTWYYHQDHRPKVTEYLNSVKRSRTAITDFFDIRPAFQFNPRMIDGAQD